MKDWSLGDVNQSLVNTGRFLDDIVTDEKKRRSLQTFVDCQEVVHWIRETTTGKFDNYIIEVIESCFL